MKEKLYPDSGIELNPFVSSHYDKIMNIGSFGRYRGFIRKAVAEMEIEQDDQILDMGCGTGRNTQHMIYFLGKKGGVTGLDISEEMEQQFNRKFRDDDRVRFMNQRIDVPFNLDIQFDKIFISFVIHGFPHEVRIVIIQNVLNHLKPGGSFIILDWAEFDMAAMPALHRRVFKTVECIYAFDFIKRDWKAILTDSGFSTFQEHFHLKGYVRLLRAQKL